MDLIFSVGTVRFSSMKNCEKDAKNRAWSNTRIGRHAGGSVPAVDHRGSMPAPDDRDLPLCRHQQRRDQPGTKVDSAHLFNVWGRHGSGHETCFMRELVCYSYLYTTPNFLH